MNGHNLLLILNIDNLKIMIKSPHYFLKFFFSIERIFDSSTYSVRFLIKLLRPDDYCFIFIKLYLKCNLVYRSCYFHQIVDILDQ